MNKRKSVLQISISHGDKIFSIIYMINIPISANNIYPNKKRLKNYFERVQLYYKNKLNPNIFMNK